jgi:hypothetical protein
MGETLTSASAFVKDTASAGDWYSQNTPQSQAEHHLPLAPLTTVTRVTRAKRILKCMLIRRRLGNLTVFALLWEVYFIAAI